MTIERQIRRKMIIILREIDTLPHKQEREQLLWDTMHFCAGLLNVNLELEDQRKH